MPRALPTGRRLLLLPLGFATALGAFCALPAVRDQRALLHAFAGTTALLVAWALALLPRAGNLRARFVLRRPHWLQPLVQGSIFLYWGWHWPVVASSAWLIAAQVIFAYAFDLLVAFTVGEELELGLGPLPVVFSINLFLWFKPEWFAWQFALLAAGFAAKRLVRWTKDGRPAHIFNPSSLPLALASIVLLATGTTDHTWGNEIALTLGKPLHMFEFIFLVSLPGQLLFGVASMTMPAVLTAAALAAVYFAATGVYFFFGTLPTAAFLGMLLLFTDPATAPKSELGRVLYGVCYGASVFVLYGLLDALGQPTFYDKLLLVPVLNLGVQIFDRVAQASWLRRLDPARLLPRLKGRARNAGWAALWGSAFATLLAFHAVGDTHPANRLPFWEKACAEGRRNACRNLLTMESRFCEDGSGWACNELALRQAAQPMRQVASFDRACTLGFAPACANLRGGQPSHGRPQPADYNVMLEDRGLPRERTALQIWQWACAQGWSAACDDAQAVAGAGTPEERARSNRAACTRGEAAGCRALGLMYRRGDGVPRDDRRALVCELGISGACAAP